VAGTSELTDFLLLKRRQQTRVPFISSSPAVAVMLSFHLLGTGSKRKTSERQKYTKEGRGEEARPARANPILLVFRLSFLSRLYPSHPIYSGRKVAE